MRKNEVSNFMHRMASDMHLATMFDTDDNSLSGNMQRERENEGHICMEGILRVWRGSRPEG